MAETVRDKVLKAESYEVLRCLLIETDEKTFTVFMSAIVEYFDGIKEIEAFSAYFNRRHCVLRV